MTKGRPGGTGKTSQITKRVGETLRRLREERQMSQAALAKAASTSRSEINGIESGQRSPTIISLDYLARGLGVPITAFFEKEKPPSPRKPTPEEAQVSKLALRLRGRDLSYLRHIEEFLRWFDRTRPS